MAAFRVGAAVVIDGHPRGAESVRVDREIATTLPEQVAGGGGILKATGTLELAQPEVVSRRRRGPWSRSGGWPPAQMDPARVDAVLDGQVSRLLTGRVSTVAGGVSGPVRVGVEDRTDDLRVSFSHDALLRAMPSLSPGEPWRRLGLRTEYVVDRVLRQAGFFSTPPSESGAQVVVPAQGSHWPLRGTVSAAGVQDTGTWPGWYRAPWGWCFGNALLRYTPASMQTIASGLQLSMLVAPDHAGTANLTASTVQLSESIRLQVNASRSVTASIQGAAGQSHTWSPPSGWRCVELRVQGSTWTLRTDNGGQEVFSLSGHSGWSAALVNDLRVAADPGARIGAFQLSFHTGMQAVAHTPNATMLVGSLFAHLEAMPALTSRSGLDLLREISEAMVASMWIDVGGHLWWVHPDRLIGAAPTSSVSATADLLDFAWRDQASTARRSVTVRWSQASITRSGAYAGVSVWEGPGDTLAQGESAEYVFAAPAGESWIMVDTSSQGILNLGRWGLPTPTGTDRLDLNRGRGTWHGGTPMNPDGDSASSMEWDDLVPYTIPWVPCTITKIGPEAWRANLAVNVVSDARWSIAQRINGGELDNTLGTRRVSEIYSGQRLPLVRARAKVEWEDAETTSAITGPTRFDALTHEVGPWVQGEAATGRLADWIATRVTAPAPTLEHLPMPYRPDLAAGQVIDVMEDVVHEVHLRVLVTAVSVTVTEASALMQLTCRVISATTTRRMTYDELAAAGGTYIQLAAAGGTYDELGRPT